MFRPNQASAATTPPHRFLSPGRSRLAVRVVVRHTATAKSFVCKIYQPSMFHLKLPFLTKSTSQETTYAPSTTSDSHEPLPSPLVAVVVNAWDSHDWKNSSDAFTDWLNARWAKSGYQVSNETICFTLRSKGRDARIGLGDPTDGAFCRKRNDAEK